ncbi:cell wall metabolism sensor histidine kinase WalK [Thermoclostridium stercorarium]|uniref:sensor histidine kinase n=1 Tax=Thermoclostridium stercorarium TaxID=1510 RepID=UPI0022494517|nr:ATP-binding protein [Thermoclostridium stercorarium]UZQ85640.1 cell wall metabolism sensor histidine kinase WalK [Thermoclostridium stercorarium]
MFSGSLQWRLVFIIVAITFVLMSVIWVFLNYKVDDIFYNDFKKSISDNYATLNISEKMTCRELLDRFQEDPVILSQFISSLKSYTIIKDGTYEIVYSSDIWYQEDKTGFRNEIMKSRNLMAVMAGASEGKGKYLTKSSKGDFYDYVIRQPLIDGDYILFFKYNRSQALSIISEFSQVIVSGMFIAVAVTIVIGILLSKTITRPIIDIIHKAENITSGDFGQVLEVKSDDEIGKLTSTFNYMETQLRNMLNELSNEKNKFEMIINYMTDGIIAFNKDGFIIHINSAALSVLEMEQCSLTFPGIMDRLGLKYELSDLLKRENLSEISENVRIKDKFFRVQFASFTDKENNVEGLITVLQDYTEQMKLDNMRKEFVANVSHELKTPLTSIKSYAETLLDGALDDRETARSFLEVIYSESNRMDRLVKDLLLLSKHDSGIKLNLTRISPIDLVNGVVARMKMSADEKKQTLSVVEEEKAPDINGDEDRLEQLLVNVIGNAIKYTPENGSITVYVGKAGKNACIRVVDTGIGIPEEHLDRIFERFYRVDKARSRQMGGTGLGLSIASEIVKAHGGTIKAESKVNQGTAIIITLPGISEETNGENDE